MKDRLAEMIAELGHAQFAERQREMVALKSIGDAMITMCGEGTIGYLNQVAESLTGWSGKTLCSGFVDLSELADGKLRMDNIYVANLR